MKIGIANDSITAAEALRRVVSSSAEHQVLWIARNGREAVERCAAQLPDLVLMDLNMPEMDGVEATRQIMQSTPCAILVVTGRPQDNFAQVFKAMGAGALDVTATPLLMDGQVDDGNGLLHKIRTMGKLIRAQAAAVERSALPPTAVASGTVQNLVAIGASTGGPIALARVLSGWRVPDDTAVVVVQHIDENFSSQLCRWLGDQLSTPTRVIGHGDSLHPGEIQIAKTNDHLALGRNLRMCYQKEPADYPYRPSVDVFFHGVARNWKGKAIGVLLTGMGRDGAGGLLAMRQAGHLTVAQDESSSAVYGMPRAAAELDAAQIILPLDKIGTLIRGKMGEKIHT
jgi:two-component system response regulator WspF